MRKIWTEAQLTERGRILLSASVGEMPVTQACEKLGITRQRFYELEDRGIQGFLEAIQPRPAGRPAKAPDPAAEGRRRLEDLERENRKLWLYVKVLRSLAGIEDEEKKRGRAKGTRRPEEAAHRGDRPRGAGDER